MQIITKIFGGEPLWGLPSLIALRSEQSVLRYRVNGPLAGTKKKKRKAKTIDLHLHADLKKN